MITIEARILENVIEIDEDGKKYQAKPKGWNEKGLKGAWKRFVTMDYILFDKDDKIIGTVAYDGKKDEIVILKDRKMYRTEHLWFKPDEFKYMGDTYLLHEKLSGMIVITRRAKVVAKGEITGYSIPSEQLQSWQIPEEEDEKKLREKMSEFLEKVVAKGKAGFTTVKFMEYDEKIAEMLKFLGTGYCIKMLLFQIFI